MLSRVRRVVPSNRHTIIAFLALITSAAAQQPPSSSGGSGELPQIYAQGMAAFQSGDYAKAASDLEAVVTKAEFSPQLEPAFFTLGSAYFNIPDYKKAIAAFKNYQTKFP